MNHDRKLPAKDEVWKHYKGGTYVIVGIGFTTSKVPTAVVVYQGGNGTIWCRPLDEFMSRHEDLKFPKTEFRFVLA